MKLVFLTVGKAHEAFVKEGIEIYTKRISNYFPVSWTIIPPGKATQLAEAEQKKVEGNAIRQLLKEGDYLVALDERGTTFTSETLSRFIQQRATESVKRLVFLIGGAYGLDKTVLEKAQFKWSLSLLTFPHQLVRLILAEQIYRACTILRNEKYHHGN
jgi:23S rRNA (pseudouridine1915-N3)-methyltransferase